MLPAGSCTINVNYGGVANFAASSGSVTCTVSQATPTVTVSDAGGACTGNPFPATPLVAGVLTGMDTTPSASLEGVSPTCLYYVGSTVSGAGSSTPPSAQGTYTVVASFAGATITDRHRAVP